MGVEFSNLKSGPKTNGCSTDGSSSHLDIQQNLDPSIKLKEPYSINQDAKWESGTLLPWKSQMRTWKDIDILYTLKINLES